MIPYTTTYRNWATFAARMLLAIQFGLAAAFKIMGFSGEVAQTAAVGVPMATVAVGLALILEIVGTIALLTGWQIRRVTMVLAPYVALLAVLFYHNWSDPMVMGAFFSHFGLIAALLYISATGSSFLSLSRD